ncbi:ABC transporter substrate-binding protein [Pseudogemmobacter bohemicus]|uniref:ABC transporter substrate-binding protein n=1 Tax=Pseudogemmobacter bohemicus TaxID=2250708 RepID=UPI000DD30784|nr:ABC transporter substrate-binding protein [Pseudogemmobacter bohemicus]
MTTQLTRRSLFALALAPLLPGVALAARNGTPRLVTTELILTETALALGLSPLAAGNLPLYRRLVGTPSLPATTHDLGPLNEPNMELLVHLAPDLILAADWQRGPQAALERIAPTLWLETLPFVKPPLDIASDLATAIAGAAGASAAPLIAGLDQALAALAQRIRVLNPPPVLLVRFLEDGRHALAFTLGSMPGDLLARAGGRNALEAGGPPGALPLGLSEIIALGAPLLATGPLPQSALFRRVLGSGALRAIQLPPVFPAGGLASAARLCEALGDGLERI